MKRKVVIYILILILLAEGAVFAYVKLKSSNRQVHTDSTTNTTEEIQNTVLEISTPTPEIKGTSEKEVFMYDKYTIYPEVLRHKQVKNKELYNELYDSIDQAVESFDFSSYDVSENDLEAIILALWNKCNYEFWYIDNIIPEFIEKNVVFKYEYTYDEIISKKEIFNDKIQEIISLANKPEYTELQKTLIVYSYIANNTLYDYSENGGLESYDAYSVITNNSGICYGYSNALRYLLGFLDIECEAVISNNLAHQWNIVNIDGSYYHLDATFENNYGLEYFGMTDERRLYDYPDGWFCGNQNYEKFETPKCDNTRYDFLSSCGDYIISDSYLMYIDYSVENSLRKFDFSDNNITDVFGINTSIFILSDAGILFSNINDSNRLYLCKEDGTITKLADDEWIYEISVNGKSVNYKYFINDGDTAEGIVQLS